MWDIAYLTLTVVEYIIRETSQQRREEMRAGRIATTLYSQLPNTQVGSWFHASDKEPPLP